MIIAEITHGVDLDGLGSQAIVRRYFTELNSNEAPSFYLYYAHYTNFISQIKKILSLNFPEKLIITDIGFNDDFTSLFPLFEKAIKNGTHIYWFDHHIVEPSYKNKLESLLDVYVNDPKRCGAEIVNDYYLPDDKNSQEIAKLARDIDFRNKRYEVASDIQSIISFNRGKKKNLKKIVNYLAENNFHNEWFTQQLEKAENWELTQKENILKNLSQLHINGIGTMVLSTASIGGGKITRFLEEKYPNAGVFIGIDNRFDEIIIYSDLINCRELARTFQGGGHKNRAGFHYEEVLKNLRNINPKFLEDLKEEIKKLVGKHS